MYKLLLALFLSVSFSAYSDTNQKIERLMKAQGMLEMWQQQIDLGRSESKKQADKMLDQFMAELNPGKEYTERFRAASEKFIQRLEGKWTAKEIVDVWASYFGPNFTEDELDQLLAFYTSDIGKKEVEVNKATLLQFTAHFQKENEELMKVAIGEYISDLKIIAKECKCRKKI